MPYNLNQINTMKPFHTYSRLSVILILLVFLISSCNLCFEGAGPIEEETRDLNAFAELELDIDADVVVRIGERHSMTISAQENLLEMISTEVRSGNLTIEADPCISSHYPVNIDIETNSLSSIQLNGSGDITIIDELHADDVDMKINGSGNLTADVFTNDLRIKINGSGDIMLTGTADDADIAINGSGSVNASSLQAYQADVKINGSGNTSINALNSLKVNVKGSGDVKYSGDPTIKTSISGSGSVTKMN